MTDSWPGPGALDTGTGDLLAAVDNGVATIVLNRPARRNALSDEMLAPWPGCSGGWTAPMTWPPS
jgi:hypothetical protein